MKNKVEEEKFLGRVVTVGCTLITLFVLLVGDVPTTGAWLMGVLNGFMILTQVIYEFEED